MSKYSFEIPATDENNLEKIENSIEHFKNEIILMSLKSAQTDKIFKLTKSIIGTYSEVIKSVVPLNEKKSLQNINAFQRRMVLLLENNDSNYKRKKQLKKSDTFVEPEEKALGFKWTQTFDETSGKIVRKYVQNTFQFVRPSATIQALFSDPNFEKMYFENMNKKSHTCEKNVYYDYCCGSDFQQNDFFKQNPSALYILLYTDDFEPCDALKSKAGVHKKCAFYMIIRNMPRKTQSKLSNIFLVALADSKDFKQESTNFNSILEVILEDLKVLETYGIKVLCNVVKAGLGVMLSDNLGINICYGLAQGFSANYFCRFCICHKSECKRLTKEDPSKLRDIESYNEMCAKIAEYDNLDLTETIGIKQYCKLNDLSNFHILKNYSVDPMHDLLEGAVPFALHRIFEYCLKKKLFDSSHLKNLIQFFNYGYLNKRNIPSKIKLDSKNLGQNATQLHCLILNISFIFYPYKNELEEIWPYVQSLLKIIEIVYSDVMNEEDVQRLENEIELHTGFILEFFKQDLIPKHHILLHYPRVIRTMGPVAYTSVMRLEAKHQELKTIAQKTNNFVNLNKTIAEKHQIAISLKKCQFNDEIQPGKFMNFFENIEEFETYKSLTSFTFKGNETLVKSLNVNSLVFKPGLLLFYESKFFEISHILQLSDNYLFLCDNSFNVKHRDLFCNSLILDENPSSINVIDLSELTSMKSYQKVFLQGEIHVICDDSKMYAFPSNPLL